MAVIRTYSFLLVSSILFWTACTQVRHISEVRPSYTAINARSAPEVDSSIVAMIQPYKAGLETQMVEVVAEVETKMTKAKPEGELGNWVADATLSAARQAGFQADFALMNYGGLRIPEIPPGPLTVGKIYELSPFDNQVVVVDMPGYLVDSLFQKVAASEGWPVSSEVRMEIKNRTVASLTIGGLQVVPDKIYRVVTVDYVADGGDQMNYFVSLPRKEIGKFARDLLIDNARATQSAGKKIAVRKEGRIVIVE